MQRLLKKILILSFALLVVFEFGYKPFIETTKAVNKSTSVNVPVRPKSLTLTLPSTVTIDPVDVSQDSVDTEGTMTGVEVSDLRGIRISPGWSLAVTATNFKTDDNDIIPVSNFSIGVTAYTLVAGTDGGIITPGIVVFQDTNNDGLSEAVTILTAQQSNGRGRFRINPVLRLSVPPFSVAGDYRSTIVMTLS